MTGAILLESGRLELARQDSDLATQTAIRMAESGLLSQWLAKIGFPHATGSGSIDVDAVGGEILIASILTHSAIVGDEIAVSILAPLCDLEARDDQGMTALMWSAHCDRIRICKMLMQAGADPSAFDRHGRDALRHAAGAGNPSCVALLLAVGDPKASSPTGRTALQHAVESASPRALECVDLLLPASDLDAVNAQGRSALDLALRARKSEIAGRISSFMLARAERIELTGLAPAPRTRASGRDNRRSL